MSWRRKAYDELPALSVRRVELRRTLRVLMVAAAFGGTWFGLVSGGQVKSYCRMLGFNDFHFGLMGAIPFLATFGQLIAAILIERTGLKKHLFVQCGSLSRLAWLAAAAVPLLLPLPSHAAVAMMLIAVGIHAFSWALAVPAVMTWLGELVPRRIRGRYIANRDRVSIATQTLAVIAVGVLLDVVTVRGAEETAAAQPVLLAVISVVFAAASVLGAIDILMWRKVRDVLPAPRPVAETHAASIRNLLIDPFKDRVFRHYVAFGATITFSMTVGGWYFWLHAMEALRFSKLTANVLFLVLGPVAGIFTIKGWGRLIDRWGRRPTLILGTIGTLLSLLPWLVLRAGTHGPQPLVAAVNSVARFVGALIGRPDWTWASPQAPIGAFLLAAAGCIVGYIAWTGVYLAQMGIVMGFADGHGRSKYVAASSVTISLGGVLGGLVGGTIAQALHHLQSEPLVIGPLVWNNWQVTFLVAMAGRLASLTWLARMPDPGARPVRHLLRSWRANVYNNVSTRLFYPLRIFGWDRARRRQQDAQEDDASSE